ncbi:MAG: 2-5 ligase [Pedosphaera sp.]|nr:2-5 ligase [Pedosphaera sp.]
MIFMSKDLRIFIALAVSTTVKDAVRCLQNELREQLPDNVVRWTRPEQFHLTLNFLGNIAAENVEELVETVRGVCRDFGPIVLRAEKMGFFPLKGPPRVIWISMQDERKELPRLQRTIAAATARFIAQNEESDFTGHLTIGRARNLKPAQGLKMRELAKNYIGRSFGNWNADVVEIMRSELGPEGSRYSCLVEIPLKEQIG